MRDVRCISTPGIYVTSILGRYTSLAFCKSRSKIQNKQYKCFIMATMHARKFCEKVSHNIVITYRYDKNQKWDAAKILRPTKIRVFAIINCDIFSMFKYIIKI